MRFEELKSQFDVPLYALDFAALTKTLESGSVESFAFTKAA
jgi:hypothetical protein